MGGDWYLEQMIGKLAVKCLDEKKAKAVEYIFNRMCNRGVDPIEFFDEMRVLLDIKDRHGESTKPKLYELDTYSESSFDGAHTVILANDETEARLIAAVNGLMIDF